MKSPIFIFSLPRAGSTLLQRMLLSHPQIGGTAEPWLMLPFVYTMKEYGVFSEYSHRTCHIALGDFVETLPDKENTYYKYLAEFCNNLYKEQLKKGEIYFLDKTPRYYLIIPEILRMYPDAKFIFLFRNPLSILSSIITTWNNGKLRLHGHYIDLFNGPDKLGKGYELAKDKAISVQYEDLVTNTDDVLVKIFEYLDINSDDKIKEKFNKVNLSGRAGDKTGRADYDVVKSETLNKWKSVINSRRRVSFAENYLKKIGKDVLKIHGYNQDALIDQLKEIKPTRLGYIHDNWNLCIGLVLRLTEYKQIRIKIKERKIDKKKPYVQHL